MYFQHNEIKSILMVFYKKSFVLNKKKRELKGEKNSQ